MTSEATLTQINNTQYRQVSVADGSAFSKGSIMYFEASDGTVNHYTSGASRVPAGLLAVEKVANDGQTTVPVLVRGTATMAVGATTVVVGDMVKAGAADNSVIPLAPDVSNNELKFLMGKAETGATSGNSIRVRIALG